MENASKALIIAGAILLSIAIIGLGMGIFDKASNMMNDPGMDEATINAFNGKFESYVGTNKSGSDVKNLIQTMITHNNANIDDPSMQVRLLSDGATHVPNNKAPEKNVKIPGTAKSKIKSGRTYRVEIDYSEATGLICSIDISIKKTDGSGYETIDNPAGSFKSTES